MNFTLPARFLKAAALIAINATDEIVLESPLPVGDDYGINIPTHCLKSLPPPIGKQGIINIDDSDARIRITGADGLAVSSNAIEANYPKWRQVIPSGPDVLMNGIHWNAELVTGFSTVAKMLSREESSILHIHQKGEKGVGPYIIKPELAGLWLGVLMPVRSDIDGSIPDWLTVASVKK